MTARTLKLCLAPLLLLTFACNRNPETVKKNYIERGNEYFKNGKYKEASIMYRSALKKDLKYGEAYYRLGLSELRLGRPGEIVLELHHAGIGEQQRRVVVRHQRRRGHDLVAVPAEILEEGRADFVGGRHVSIARRPPAYRARRSSRFP